jgi:hypothetical protein
MTKQSQKGGNDSINVQAEQITIHHHGLTVADVREIALDVFRSNFYTLSDMAADVARQRAKEITEKFLTKLAEENSAGLEQAQDPDFQYALYIVQKEYARKGDKELGDLLVDLLVDRTKEKSRSLRQIVLSESLAVVPKLTVDQLAALSVIFMIRYNKNYAVTVDNLDRFARFLDLFQPFASQLSKKDSCYQHLQYCGCGSPGVPPEITYDIFMVFTESYKGLFSKGFEPEKLKERGITVPSDSILFTRCLHAADKLQINPIFTHELQKKASELGLEPDEINKLKALINDYSMNGSEIVKYLVSVRPYMRNVLDVWGHSPMRLFALTSVGVAIGHSNLKKYTRELGDLSTWID